jgi:probable addiction module antidote protein
MTTIDNTHQRIETTVYDTAEYLQTEEDMRLYFEACIEEDAGDGVLIRAAINDICRARGMSQMAKDTGIERESLYKALSAEGNPNFATMLKIFKALSFSWHVKTNTPTMA